MTASTLAGVPDAAQRYDWECRHVLHRDQQDLGFWLRVAQAAGGPVLELACGTGRLTAPLAAAGVRLVGLDHDPVMLAAAKRRLAGAAPLVAADMRRFSLACRFSLVFVGYNSVQLLGTDDELTACLRCAGEHTTPGGMVGVEVTDFQCGAVRGDVEPVLLARAAGIELWGSLAHDLASRVSHYRRCFKGDGWLFEDEVAMRSLGLAELETAFRSAGLRLRRSWVTGATVRAVAGR